MRFIALMLLPTVALACCSAPRAVDGTVPSLADGVPIHYHAEGRGQPAVVFVHGWSCDSRYWESQVKEIGATHQVVTLDLAGHGQSGRDRADWSIPAFAQDVRAVIERLGLERTVLVGHSLSGAVILETSRLLPDRVAALIPVDTFHDVEWKPGPGVDELLRAMQDDFPAATRHFVKGMFPQGADPALVERMAAQMSAAPPDIAIAILKAGFAFDSATTLSRVKQPVRCINGALFPTRLDANRRHAPQFEAVIMPGVGHFPMIERSAEFNRLLRRAIEDLVPST
ncbi:MAG: alpha/beta hydrolase [Acidobacteria bacterium]|nr:alpha/beta hydrolase [Acidobacteriota bacterium]